MVGRVHPGRVGDERAETYLRVLAESECGGRVPGFASSTPRPGPMSGPRRTRRCSSSRSARSGRSAGRAGSSSRPACSIRKPSTARRFIFLTPSRPGHGSCSTGIAAGRAAPHHIRARCRPVAASPGRPGHAGHAHRADARSRRRPRAVHGAPHVPGRDRDRGPDHGRHAYALARGRFEPGPGDHRGRTAPPAVRPVRGGGRRGDPLHGAVRAATARRMPGGASSSFPLCLRAAPGGWT